MKTRIAYRQQAFTLVEILIVLSLLSLMLGMLYSALASLTQSARLAATRSSDTDALRGSYQFLRNQLTRSVPLAQRTESGLNLFFTGYPDRILYTGTLPAHRGGGGLHFMELSLEQGSNKLMLFDKQASTGARMDRRGDITAAWREHQLLTEISAMHISYFGSHNGGLPSWQTSWPASANLPRIVRFEFSHTDGKTLPPLSVTLPRRDVAGQPQWVW